MTLLITRKRGLRFFASCNGKEKGMLKIREETGKEGERERTVRRMITTRITPRVSLM